MPDIGPVKQILAIDLPNSLKCLVMSLLQRRRRSKHHQHTAPIGDKRMTCLVESLMTLTLKLLERRTHVIDMDRRVLENLIDTLDLETLLVRTRITLGRKNETENSIRRMQERTGTTDNDLFIATPRRREPRTSGG